MQIAIVHFHLNRGGVTQVIQNHLASLATASADARPERVVVLHGGRRNEWPEQIDLPFEVLDVAVEGLEYDTAIGHQSAELAQTLAGVLESHGLDAGSTVVHAHNHALGKNASLPGALAALADRGYRLLLQIHDFVEDFRPANYRHLSRALATNAPAELAAALYPQSESIHYAALTSTDTALLNEAGVPAERAHVIPNPAAEFDGLPERSEVGPNVRDRLGLPPDAGLLVYPVRGIRRKNLGEMLLTAALSAENTWHAITLAPENPVETPSYDRWMSLANELGLRCCWDIGRSGGVPFLNALAACDSLITTSVVEGFGMVFLEAWLAGRPLVGRNVPDATRDFVEQGVNLAALRNTLEVPTAWFDTQAIAAEVLDLVHWACRDYGVQPEPGDVRQVDRTLSLPSIDFGILPSRFQSQAVRRVAADESGARETVLALNPKLAQHADPDAPEIQQLVASNAERVRAVYSAEKIGRRLCEVYARVLRSKQAAPRTPLPKSGVILRRFLRLDRMHPLRLEP